jgi:hypothetical protein
MEDKDILQTDFLINPTQGKGLSGVATSAEPLLQKGSQLSDIQEIEPGAFVDRTSVTSVNDLFNYYFSGMPSQQPVAEPPQAPILDAPTESQETSDTVDQPSNELGEFGSDTSMYGGDLDQGGLGDGITSYTNTPAEALEQQQAIDQAISDLGDLYNPMTEVPADPATASAALSGSFFVPTTETQQQAIDQGAQESNLLDTVSDAAKNAFEKVVSGASTAADFISKYGYPAYQALKGNFVAAGASILTGTTPLILGANFAGKIFSSFGDTKSEQEYNSYSDQQQAVIDKAYGPGGIMEGYYAVSQFGQGVSGTVQDRIDKLEEIISDPTRDTSNVYKIDKDGNRIFNPSFNSAEKQLAKLQNLQDEAGLTKREEPRQLTQEEIFDRDDVDPADQGDTKSDTVGTNLQTSAALSGSFFVPTTDSPGVMFDDPFQSDDTGTTDIADTVNQADVEAGLATESIQDFTDSGSDDNETFGGTKDEGVMSSDAGFQAEEQNIQQNPFDSPEGGSSSSGEGKIVCTMMNKTYGFGSFRNKIWLKQSKNLAPEYQKGYHALFLPLVKIAKTNKIVRKILEHIAVHRTIDIRQESRGKTHMLGRIYRKILEPICYWVGKYAKR